MEMLNLLSFHAIKNITLSGQTTNSYSDIFRGMKIFGGVQAFQMAVALLRGKFVAMILGQTGMGITSLFTSSAATIQQLASLGVPVATARDVAADSEASERLALTVAASRLATFLTGACAAAMCVLFASALSIFTFGSTSETLGFSLLGAFVWLQMAGANEIALMQGLRSLKRLSRSSLIASAAGLCVAVPMYYIWHMAAIVPALVAMAAIALAVSRYNSARALKENSVVLPQKTAFSEVWPVSRRLIAFGLVLTVTGVMTQAAIYLVNVFIRYAGTYEDVGYYSAGTSICNQCVTMVFAAMAMDYFPRLMKCIATPGLWQPAVRRQAELVSLLAAPLAVALMLAAPLVIQILFTDGFMPMTPMLKWMAAAIFMRSLSYPLGYVILAKGNRMLYFSTEGIACNLVFFVAMSLGYSLWGITGFGIASVIVYSADTVIYYLIARKAYGFTYGRTCRRTLPVLMLLVGLSLAASLLLPELHARVAGGLLLALTVAYTVVALRHRL